ncbi:uncharacterized protein K02A2.6-like [Ornithodoros turicata]|uniref:uncharacterized protein K02A2.6-like n=1 Tax=Ornithodoros turicata TaxID=34597 RepID=UPI00313A0D19
MTVIRELRWIFSTFGIPEKIVSDNGAPFVSAEIKDFYKSNGITLVTSAPYHPATNGLAERMVAEVKTALRKYTQGSIECRLARFLFKQHSTVSASTGETPAVRMFGREFPSSLDLRRLKRRTAYEDRDLSRARTLALQQRVWIRNFNGTPAWIPGKLVERHGLRSWIVDTGTRLQRRHLDHIRRAARKPEVDPAQQEIHISPATAWGALQSPDTVIDEDSTDSSRMAVIPTRNRETVRDYPTRARKPPGWMKDYVFA